MNGQTNKWAKHWHYVGSKMLASQPFANHSPPVLRKGRIMVTFPTLKRWHQIGNTMLAGQTFANHLPTISCDWIPCQRWANIGKLPSTLATIANVGPSSDCYLVWSTTT